MPTSDDHYGTPRLPAPKRAPNVDECPTVPLELVHHLLEMVPFGLPDLEIPDRALWYQVGRRSLVEYLKAEWIRQNDNPL